MTAIDLACFYEAARRQEAERRRGRVSEERALRVLLSSSPRPWWLLGARACTPEEDALGIDIVVDCLDRRRLWLQMKSSPAGAEKFLRHKPLGARIGVVVVSVSDLDVELYLLREDMGL